VVQGLSSVYLEQKQIEQALRIWKVEVEHHPDDRDVRINYARMAFDARLFADAVEQYRWLCLKEPSSDTYRKRLGQALLMNGDTRGALAELTRARELNSADPEIAASIAAAQDSAGQVHEAVAQYRKALLQRPNDFRIQNNLANALAKAGTDLDEALTLAQKAREKSQSDPIVLDTLGYVYLKKRMTDRAVPIFESLVKRFPQNYVYRYHLAQALLETGNRGQAKKELTEALRNEAPAPERQAMQTLLSTL
jgi:Flp pilus assembly protein TadD